MEVEGLEMDASQINADFHMGINGSGVGAYALQRSTEPTIRINQGAAFTDLPYDVRSGGGLATARHNLGFLLCIRSKEAFLLENKRVVGWRDLPIGSFSLGTVTPTIALFTKEAVAHKLTIRGLRLTLWST
jgi:hypothetical protein